MTDVKQPAVTPATATRPFRATRALGWLIGSGAFGVSLSALYASSGLGVGCLFRTVTGWACPLCGGTRLGSALLHGDLSAAASYNPLVFAALVLVTGLGLAWLVEVAGGPRVRLAAPLAMVLRRVTPTQWLLVGGAVAVAYTVLRNLP
jgi:hypothetical protein